MTSLRETTSESCLHVVGMGRNAASQSLIAHARPWKACNAKAHVSTRATWKCLPPTFFDKSNARLGVSKLQSASHTCVARATPQQLCDEARVRGCCRKIVWRAQREFHCMLPPCTSAMRPTIVQMPLPLVALQSSALCPSDVRVGEMSCAPRNRTPAKMRQKPRPSSLTVCWDGRDVCG